MHSICSKSQEVHLLPPTGNNRGHRFTASPKAWKAACALLVRQMRDPDKQPTWILYLRVMWPIGLTHVRASGFRGAGIETSSIYPISGFSVPSILFNYLHDRDQILGLAHARQAFYHWVTSPALMHKRGETWFNSNSFGEVFCRPCHFSQKGRRWWRLDIPKLIKHWIWATPQRGVIMVRWLSTTNRTFIFL